MTISRTPIARVSFVLALFGAVLTVHLWAQQQRGFDHGCWGFGAPAPSATAGCQAVEAKQLRFLGLPLVWVGYGFYSVLAVLEFVAAAGGRLSGGARTLGHLLVATAVFQAGYLVWFQAAVVHAFCPLCLTSSAIIGLLAVVRVAMLFSSPPAVVEVPAGFRDLHFMGASFLACVLFLAVPLQMLRDVDAPAANRASESETQMLKQITTRPFRIEDWARWQIPALNGPSAVNVVFFLDPNCPHCAIFYDTITAMAAEFSGKATFYVFPRVLWEYSIEQVSGLELARREGKYYEMWHLQFAARKDGGLAFKALQALFEKLKMDTTDLQKRLNTLRSATVAQTYAAQVVGIESTPNVFIGNRLLAPTERAPEALRAALNAAIAEAASLKENTDNVEH